MIDMYSRSPNFFLFNIHGSWRVTLFTIIKIIHLIKFYKTVPRSKQPENSTVQYNFTSTLLQYLQPPETVCMKTTGTSL